MVDFNAKTLLQKIRSDAGTSSSGRGSLNTSADIQFYYDKLLVKLDEVRLKSRNIRQENDQLRTAIDKAENLQYNKEKSCQEKIAELNAKIAQET